MTTSPRTSYGAWLDLDSVLAAEALAVSGFDWVAIDLQHGEASRSSVLALLAAVQGRGAQAWVRVHADDLTTAAWCLDMGADVVVVPQVSSAAEAAAAVAASRYAPDGHRSWGPARAALRPAGTPAQRLVVMIEDVAAVEDADAICATPGLGGVLVGPADLTVSLGGRVPDDLTSDRTLDATRRVVEAASAHGLAVAAYAGDGRLVPAWRGLGIDTIALACDSGMVAAAGAARLAAAREVG
ncbi:HpcH/HpaI aldolase/citrate lyase family protein [Nocardioides sp. CFH 31398]|uniref:HpcH/HpaI aldolase family protein n=1 Tax=Nocardioides sp. CFH 31398 TaxID=2919579 RepID=UPI001F054C50|nr:aldolase/citrate lyase family protein [Nocardioides sp. CFH 31398]MCH1865625.1 aldolase/citrate lyase family protein [Nocardioides sp. CFH 31398]